jgi:membrane-associated HD superfamily phosphohydrolase
MNDFQLMAGVLIFGAVGLGAMWPHFEVSTRNIEASIEKPREAAAVASVQPDDDPDERRQELLAVVEQRRLLADEAAAKAKAAEEEARFKIARQKRDAEYEIRKTKWDAESDYKRRLEEAIKKAEERRVNELSFQAAEWKKQEERLRDQHRQRIYELEREWLRKCVKYRN